MTPPVARIALYYAPPRGSALAGFGARWLGRDAETGAPVAPPPIPGLAPARQAALTEAPRRYGFHGTLVAPFVPAPGHDLAGVRAAAVALAADRPPIPLPPLTLAALGDFLALVPSAPAPALDALAADGVRATQPLRAPLAPADRARRIAGGLTARQEALLDRWGYPYVFEEFRFHLTLTGSITDPAERAALAAVLRPLLTAPVLTPPPITELALFIERERRAPFTLAERCLFGG